MPVYPHFVSPNELSRLALTASIFERGSPEVSWILPLLGPRLEDLSEVDGRIYSNKAPGGAFVALPAYAVTRLLTGPPSHENLRLLLYTSRLWLSSLSLILLGGLLWITARWLKGDSARIPRVLFLVLFATPLYAYGLLFFSHALSALLLFACWSFLWAAPRPRAETAYALAAGACLGLAVTNEYITLVPGLVILLGLPFVSRWRALALTIAGGAPFALLLALYQKAAFGSFTAISSGHERFGQFRDLSSEGLFGIGLPSLFHLAQILFDSSKGLLLFSPFLVLLPASYRWARRRLSRAQSLTLMLAPLSLLVLISGYPNWHGGWTVGMRYLVPVIPLAVFPLIFAESRLAEAFLAGASLAAVSLTTIGFPFVPEGIEYPWVSFGAHLLMEGLSAPAWTDLVLPRATGLLLWVIALALASVIAFGRKGPDVTALLGGATVWIVVAVLILSMKPLDPVERLQRSYIKELYFEQSDAMTREFPGARLPEGILSRRATERRLPPSSWPFSETEQP